MLKSQIIWRMEISLSIVRDAGSMGGSIWVFSMWLRRSRQGYKAETKRGSFIAEYVAKALWNWSYVKP